jgi:protein-disulfide isomerase
MTRLITGAALGLALMLAGCGGSDANESGAAAPSAPIAAVPPPAGKSWNEVVAETPEGGYRMGNPNAPVKLLEFASISCSHCAEFTEVGAAPLVENYVKTGTVSWEYRPFMIFPTDPGVFMLLRCRGPGPFFQLSEQLYATQRDWLGGLQQAPEGELQRLQSLPAQQQPAAFVQATGLDRFFRQRGMPEGAIQSCLANQGELQKLAGMTAAAAEKYEVTGTPTFFINGKPSGAGKPPYWPELEVALRRAVGK